MVYFPIQITEIQLVIFARRRAFPTFLWSTYEIIWIRSTSKAMDAVSYCEEVKLLLTYLLTYWYNSVTQCHSFRSHPVLLSHRVCYRKFYSYCSGSCVCVSAATGLDLSSYWMTLRKRQDIVNWRGSTRSHSVENSFWKKLWTCSKTDIRMNEWMYTHTHVNINK